MKRIVLLLLCGALLLVCGCDRQVPDGIFESLYPGEHQPVLLVDDTLYAWAGYAYNYVVAEDDDSVGIVEGETVLPGGYSEYGKIAAITENAPGELELRADFKGKGTVYTNPEQPEAVYVYFTSGEIRDRYVRFVTPVLETPTLSYRGSLYAIGELADRKRELPEGYEPIGNLKYIGRDRIPQEDFETNAFTDYDSKTLDGRQVYGASEESVLYLAQTKDSANSQWYIPCIYLGPVSDIPVLESVTEEPASFFFRSGGEMEFTYNYASYYSGKVIEDRNFSSRRTELEGAGMIPAMEEYSYFSSYVQYTRDGTPLWLNFFWSNLEENDTVQLWIASEAASGPQWLTDYEKATVTRVGDVMVYGMTTEFESLLEATLPDGSVCQIIGYSESNREELVRILGHFLENGVCYDAVAMEKGVKYSQVEPETVRQEFAPGLPDPLGVPLVMEMESAMTRDDVPYTYTQYYQYEEHNGFLEYTVMANCENPEVTQNYLGRLGDITEQDILNGLETENACSFSLGELVVTIYGYNIPLEFTLELIRSLPEYPYEEALPDVTRLFRENTGQMGSVVIGCGTPEPDQVELDYSSQVGQLMAEKALPILRGQDIPTVRARFYRETLIGLQIDWPEGLRLYVDAPDFAGEPEYQVDPEACTKTEIDGVTVYGDGTEETEQRALLFTLKDGSACTLLSEGAPEDMARVLGFLLENGVKYEAFPFEAGERYEQIDLSMVPEFFLDYVPDAPEGMTLQQVWLRSSNDTPRYVRLVFGDDAGEALEWEIFYTTRSDNEQYRAKQLCNAIEATEELCERELDLAGREGGFGNGQSIYLNVTVYRDGLGSAVYEMLGTVKRI